MQLSDRKEKSGREKKISEDHKWRRKSSLGYRRERKEIRRRKRLRDNYLNNKNKFD